MADSSMVSMTFSKDGQPFYQHDWASATYLYVALLKQTMSQIEDFEEKCKHRLY